MRNLTCFYNKLFHVTSRKYISVAPKQSKYESTLAIEVDDGSEGSWFFLLPKYKIRSEGETVFEN